MKKVEERWRARLIRYADDCVAACQGDTERVLKGMKTVLGYLGLSLNEEKTRILNAREEKFTFLGFTIQVVENPKTGKRFPLIRPSKEEEQSPSGLVLPEIAKEQPARGLVLEVGEDTKDEKCPVKKGQKVIFKRYGGQSIREENEELRLVKFDEIMAVYV